MSAAWQFDEFSPVGVELSSPDAVAGYDRNQGTDPAQDRELLDRLGVRPGTCLVDLACGTGSLVVEAARRGADSYGQTSRSPCWSSPDAAPTPPAQR